MNTEKMSTTKAARRATRRVDGGARHLRDLKIAARRAARRAAKQGKTARRVDGRDIS